MFMIYVQDKPSDDSASICSHMGLRTLSLTII